MWQVLVLIALKIFLEAAGFEVPVAAFLGVVVGWRALVVVAGVVRRRRRSRAAPTALSGAALEGQHAAAA